MIPSKMIAVSEDIVVEFQGHSKKIEVPVGKKVARDMMEQDPQGKELDFEFADKKLEKLVIRKGDGQVNPEAEKAAAKKKASKKKAAAKS